MYTKIFQIVGPLTEIIIITMIINYLLSFFWHTRSMDLILGLLAFFLIFVISSWLPFPVLHRLMLLVVNVAAIAIIVIFQPELRVALSKLSLKGRKYKDLTEFDKFLEQLSNSVYKMADDLTGALIILEKDDALEELAKKAVILNADFTPELLETIFSKLAPLHDGAVIIKDQKITAASVILPLADTYHVQKNMGTRHRAGLGLSLQTDSVVIIVSEELGKVSLARDGIITRGIKMDRFKAVLKGLFTKDKERTPALIRRNFWHWIKA